MADAAELATVDPKPAAGPEVPYAVGRLAGVMGQYGRNEVRVNDRSLDRFVSRRRIVSRRLPVSSVNSNAAWLNNAKRVVSLP
jgi:hypothetical protein